jgi:hypothetical protein
VFIGKLYKRVSVCLSLTNGFAFVGKLYLMIQRFLRSRFAFVGCEEEPVMSSVLVVLVVAVDD